MGHWARIDDNNIVQEVIVIKKAELDTGNWGDPSKWIKTSFNTFEGKHYIPNEDGQDYSTESADQSKALRFRYAGVGDIYDAENDVFYGQQPYPSWTLNTDKWAWQPPHECPNDGLRYIWDESVYQADNTQGWRLITP